MQFSVKYRPSYSLLGVRLAAGEQVQVEAGSMVSMSPDMQIDVKLSATGGFFKAFFVLSTSSFFIGLYYESGKFLFSIKIWQRSNWISMMFLIKAGRLKRSSIG